MEGPGRSRLPILGFFILKTIHFVTDYIAYNSRVPMLGTATLSQVYISTNPSKGQSLLHHSHHSAYMRA